MPDKWHYVMELLRGKNFHEPVERHGPLLPRANRVSASPGVRIVGATERGHSRMP